MNFFEQVIKKMDDARVLNAGNLRIGSLLRKLEHLNDDTHVVLTNGRNLDCHWSSYRGYYDDMAMHYSEQDAPAPPTTVRMLKEALREALRVGAMQGYKGGDYSITDDTLLWCSEWSGDASGDMVVDLLQIESKAYLVIKNQDEDDENTEE